MNTHRYMTALLQRYLTPSTLRLLDAVAALASAKNVRVALVGGLVRDLLLGRSAKGVEDADFVVEGDAVAFARALCGVLGGEAREHAPFLTATFSFTTPEGLKRSADFVTAREETYPSPASLPVVRAATLGADMARRDFTVNAMAIRLDNGARGTFLDLTGGEKDLSSRLLRTLHAESFRDDPTRMLRAARYAVRCGFELEPGTASDMRRNLKHLDALSGARLRHECELVTKEPSSAEVWQKLAQWGVLQAFHPAIKECLPPPARFFQLQEELGWVRARLQDAAPDRLLVVLLGLTETLTAAQTLDIAKRFDLAPPRQKKLCALHEALPTTRNALESCLHGPESAPPSRCHRLLESCPLEGILFLRAGASEQLRAALEKELLVARRAAPLLSGADLIALGVPPGPRLGALLRRAQDRALDGLDKTKEEAIAALRCKFCV